MCQVMWVSGGVLARKRAERGDDVSGLEAVAIVDVDKGERDDAVLSDDVGRGDRQPPAVVAVLVGQGMAGVDGPQFVRKFEGYAEGLRRLVAGVAQDRIGQRVLLRGRQALIGGLGR